MNKVIIKYLSLLFLIEIGIFIYIKINTPQCEPCITEFCPPCISWEQMVAAGIGFLIAVIFISILIYKIIKRMRKKKATS